MLYTAQKMKFSIKDFFSKCDQIRTADFVTFTEEIRDKKLNFLCSGTWRDDMPFASPPPK